MNSWKQLRVITSPHRELFSIALAVALCGLLATSSQSAVIVVDDTFPTDGPLVGQTPSPGPGGTWAAHSGAGNFPVTVVSSEVVLTHGSGSREDVSSGFAPQTSGTVNYSFDFSVDDLGTPFTGTDFEYFATFRATGGASSLLGRINLVAPNTSGDFTVGISTSAGSSDAVWGTDFNYGEVITASVDFDIDNNQAFLSLNGGTPIAATAAGASSTSILGFAFRQSTSANSETIRVDNLKVMVPVPEPTSACLLVLSGIVLLVVRRK